jgi:hypothetical protein
MKKRKIAVCISGLIRTAIEAAPMFKNFFKDEDIDVFIHTWYEPNVEDHTEIIEKIKELYEPKVFQIDVSPNTERLNFEVMLKTIMLSNELKKKYEIENNFRYDVVVKYRFDILFPQHIVFPPYEIQQRTLYYPFSNLGVIHTDYENHGMTDVIFWGDSQTMDIITDTYRHFKFNLQPVRDFFKLKKGFISKDLSDTLMSPGQMLYQYALKHNIFPMVPPKGPYDMVHSLWRVNVREMNPFTDFDKIMDFYINQYR